jgi:hypothetical protein
VPTHSKALRTAIGVKISVKGLRASSIIGARSKYVKTWKGKVFRPVKYAHLVEKHQPYLNRSLTPAILAQVKQDLKAAIEEELGR